MVRAIFPGSFSPPTLGHLDLIRRGAALFDELIVAVMVNPKKQYAFSADERVDMLQHLTEDLPNVRVLAYGGLLMELAKREQTRLVLRGVRDGAELEAEAGSESVNRTIGGLETVFLRAAPQFASLSSSVVRECAHWGLPLQSMVDGRIVDFVSHRLRKR